MHIRAINQCDQDAIIEMYNQLHKIDGQVQIAADFPTPFHKSEIHCLLFVADNGKTPIGFIWGNHIVYGPSKYGMVEELFVKPESRKQGIGKALLTEILHQFKALGTEVVFISVEQNNKRAIQFYESNGFNICTGRFYYRKP